jgi:hypothetical protein
LLPKGYAAFQIGGCKKQNKRATENQEAIVAAAASSKANTMTGRGVYSSSQLLNTAQAYMDARAEGKSTIEPEKVTENKAKALKVTAEVARASIITTFDGYSEKKRLRIKDAFSTVVFSVAGLKKVFRNQKNDVLNDATLLSDILEWQYENNEGSSEEVEEDMDIG